MTNDPNDDRAMEALFETARETTPELDDTFVARLMPSAPEKIAHSETHSSPRFDILAWLPALGGLGMATALGVWIGVAVPIDALLNIDVLSTTDALDLSAFYAGADPGVFFLDETGL